MRNISFTFTTPQVKGRTKTVTRRKGWKFLIPGDLLCAIEKGRGLRKGEKVKRLGIIHVTQVRQEPLNRILDDPVYGRSEVILEGFSNMSPADFVARFCQSHRGCRPHSRVTRIQFEYRS